MTELERYAPPRAHPRMRRRRPIPRVSPSAYGSMYAQHDSDEPLATRYAAGADVDDNAKPSMLMQVLMVGTSLGRFLHIGLKMVLPIAVTWVWLHMYRQRMPA